MSGAYQAGVRRARGVALAMSAVTLFVTLAACPGAAPVNGRQRKEPPIWPPPDTSRSLYAIHQGRMTNLPAADTLNGFATRTYTDARGESLTYYLYTPPQAVADPHADLPLTLVLIGAGERATPNSTAAQNRARVLNDPYVMLWTSAAVQRQWQGYVLVPQVAAPGRWVDVPGSMGSYQQTTQPATGLALAKAVLDQTLAEAGAGVDTRRVYVTGISMGAYGVWDAIERWPGTFAAAAPVSGAGDPSRAGAITSLPIWDFHGSTDKTVPISGSEDMIAAIEALGGHPKFTIIPSAGHDIWVKAYTYPGFLAWLYTWRAPD